MRVRWVGGTHEGMDVASRHPSSPPGTFWTPCPSPLGQHNSLQHFDFPPLSRCPAGVDVGMHPYSETAKSGQIGLSPSVWCCFALDSRAGFASISAGVL